MARGGTVGLDIATGEPCDPATAGIYDNYLVKRQARCAHRGCFITAFRTPAATEVALRTRDMRHMRAGNAKVSPCHPALLTAHGRDLVDDGGASTCVSRHASTFTCIVLRTPGCFTLCAGCQAVRVEPAQVLESAPVVASQLLLVDEVIRAGMNMRRQG